MFGDKATKKRINLARSLERAAVPERPFIGRGPRYLVHPTITAACAPSLLAIAAALRNDPAAFSADELEPVQSFITNAWSPLFGRDETAAMREAIRLQHAVLDPKPGAHDRGQAKRADAEARYQGAALTSATGTIAAATALIAALAAAAVLIAPAAFGGTGGTHQAATASSSCPCNVGLPASPSAAGLAAAAILVPAHRAATAGSLCPCNVSLPIGAGVGGRAAAILVRAHRAATAGSLCPCNVGLPRRR